MTAGSVGFATLNVIIRALSLRAAGHAGDRFGFVRTHRHREKLICLDKDG